MPNRRVAILKSGAREAQSGGLEKYTSRLAKAFLEKGCSVTLLTSGTPKDLPAGLETFTLSSTSKLSFRKLKQFDQFCQKRVDKTSPEIVFGMDRNRFQTHLRAGNGVHAAYLEMRSTSEGLLKKVSFELNPLHRALLKIEKEAFEHPALERLFTNSHMVKEEILRYYSTDPKKISVVHNGVEWQEMSSPFEKWAEQRARIMSAFDLDSDLFHFLFVGHNFRRKGVEQLLRGASLLPNEKLHISIVGHDKNLKEYEELAADLNLQRKVRFFGSRKEILPFYQLADALVIPSFYDPFANVTVEALAMGLFVVSSKSNGGHEVLTEKSGLTIEDLNSPDAMASALKKALNRRKTEKSASEIRESIKHLDFSNQLNQIVKECL
ncbi:MAG: glycosyltransferase family 4 protein [Chlamydiales bacterium]|nr:glycosyltransferase family 4 protein [Chlamydiales bacterium]